MSGARARPEVLVEQRAGHPKLAVWSDYDPKTGRTLILLAHLHADGRVEVVADYVGLWGARE